MNQTGYYGPTPDVDTRSNRLRNRIMVGGGVLPVVALIAFIVSLPFFSTEPGTCDAWVGCRVSAREQWVWQASSMVVLAFALGGFLVWWAYAWRPLLNRPNIRKVVSIICLVIAAPVILLSLFAAAVVLDCSGGGWVCGPELSAFAASPALVAGALSAALIAGLRMKDQKRRHQVSTTAVLIVTGTFVACLTGTVAGLILAPF